MLLACCALLIGLVVLIWSADRFVDGASGTARYLRMPPLLIGMVVIGFGTSAPEMAVSALAALQGNPGIALGNAYGSNVANIGLILGLTALLSPISVKSGILRKELPVLAAVTALSAVLLIDNTVSHTDAWILLGLFSALMAWAIREGLRHREDSLSGTVDQELPTTSTVVLSKSLSQLIIGLVFLVLASRALVWGAVIIARGLGVSDLIIGLTIVALGTSLPELAAAIAAVRKNEHDLALGNVIGSNLFNTLAVVGIAGAIQPIQTSAKILTRDIPVMAIMTLSLFVICSGFRKPARINRIEGALLFSAYIAYMGILALTR